MKHLVLAITAVLALAGCAAKPTRPAAPPPEADVAPEAARAFIDYLLKPESIAELTNSLYFANANRAATPLLDAAVSRDPDIYPGPELRARLFAEQALPLREMRQRTRLWTAFRTQY